MIKATTVPQWQRSLNILTLTIVGAVAIALLYWAQAIFIPVALAAYLTFLLSPVVSFLRQRRIGRTPAVILTVFMAAVVLGMAGWVVTTQVSALVRELPKYTENIKEKVKSLKNVATRSSALTKMLGEVNRELVSQPNAEHAKQPAPPAEKESGTNDQPPLIIQPQSSPWITRLSSFLAPLMEDLGQFALAIILVVFMLEKREELRNRIIRLVGQGKVVTATKFVDEAGQRTSRFLLMQAIVNTAFGLILGLGLLFMGVKYALLWGFLAATLRYLPYLGPYLAALFPIGISLAMFDGWGTALGVAGLFAGLELVVANFIEPWLYGQSMGVSSIALLVSAAFWAFLWGPVGLVLSSPLTVCLVVLGRHVPQLEFLAIILGDEPALDTRTSFYQRLLARDQDEAEELVFEQLKLQSEEVLYDEILIPTLRSARLSQARGDITAADEQYVLQAINEIRQDLGEKHSAPTGLAQAESGENAAEEPAAPVQIFGFPAHDAAAELLDQIAERRPGVVCLATIPPGGLARTRFLCKRLRARFPLLKILVCRWAPDASKKENLGQLLDAGADRVTTTLLETRQELGSLLPIVVHLQKQSEKGQRESRLAPLTTDSSRRGGRRSAHGRPHDGGHGHASIS
jgi:predicted PurR-regulated permease PerM